MLKETDLKTAMKELAYDEAFDAQKARLAELQQALKEKGIPLLVAFEGWGAAGKGRTIAKLISSLDPRGFLVTAFREANPTEKRYPFLHRYWQRVPAFGHIAIWDRSWYREATTDCLFDKAARAAREQRLHEIVETETQLAADGCVLVKIFLHIGKKEQKKRLKKLEAAPETRWRVSPDDWRRHERYEECLELFDDTLERTNLPFAPWHVVAATDKRHAVHETCKIVIEAMEKALADRAAFQPHIALAASESAYPTPLPPAEPLTRKVYDRLVEERQDRLRQLHNLLYLKKIPLILAFEGWDAAGKGGTIKRISRALDPRGYEVVPVAAPNEQERQRPYLWRFWTRLPKDGHIAIYDRTWYGRVMVERVEGFCHEADWERAYEEINRFERQLVDWGAVVRKFWLQIDPDTQLQRFEDRQNTPEKQWKITEEDWRNREKWPQYEVALGEMLEKTNTPYAPWTIVPSDDKLYARIVTLDAVIAAIEARLEEE